MSSQQSSTGSSRDKLFQILMDDEGRGLTLIHAAPIRTAEDFRRVRSELAGAVPADRAAAPSTRR